jgi:heme exporter protein CcmB
MLLFCLHNIIFNLITIPTTFFLFSLYCILIPLILGFWQELLYPFHLGILWTCLLFSFLPENVYTLDYYDGTLEFFYFSRFPSYSFILFSKLIGYWILKLTGILYSYVLFSFFFQYELSLITSLTFLIGSFLFSLISSLYASLTVSLQRTNGQNGLQYLASLPTLLPLLLLCNYIQIETTHFVFLFGLAAFYFLLFMQFTPYVIKNMLNR